MGWETPRRPLILVHPYQGSPPWEALNQDLPAGMLRRPLLHVKKAQCKIHSFTEKLATFYTVTCTDQALLSSQLKLTVHPHCRAARPYLSLALNELGCVNAGVSSSEGCLLTAWGCSTNTDLKYLHPFPSLTLPAQLHQGNHLAGLFPSEWKQRGVFILDQSSILSTLILSICRINRPKDKILQVSAFCCLYTYQSHKPSGVTMRSHKQTRRTSLKMWATN